MEHLFTRRISVIYAGVFLICTPLSRCLPSPRALIMFRILTRDNEVLILRSDPNSLSTFSVRSCAGTICSVQLPSKIDWARILLRVEHKGVLGGA